MANARMVALLRDAHRAGWRRSKEFSNSMMIVWHRDPAHDVIVLEPGPRGHRWAILRLLQTIDGELVTVADCKVSAWRAGVDVLAAYGFVGRQHSQAYERGRADGRAEVASAPPIR